MAKTLTREDVQRIAALARLELTAGEIALFADQLSAILAYADQVQQVDTSEIGELPNSAILDSAIPQTRDDALVPSLSRDQLLDQAPDADRPAGLFKVPRVLGS
jgi:aspartyl-tRNA(Asn)/glutamyl-tRNA(Gln) amidotransferase subunit C